MLKEAEAMCLNVSQYVTQGLQDWNDSGTIWSLPILKNR